MGITFDVGGVTVGLQEYMRIIPFFLENWLF